MAAHEELKPCPFCGGRADRIDIEDGENAGGSCIACETCGASGAVEFEFKENFISNWNRRAAPPRFTVEQCDLGSWLVMDTRPGNVQRSNWAVERDARAEAARLEASPNSYST